MRVGRGTPTTRLVFSKCKFDFFFCSLNTQVDIDESGSRPGDAQRLIVENVFMYVAVPAKAARPYVTTPNQRKEKNQTR